MDEHLAAVAAHLAGPFTAEQAAQCGVTRSQLRRAVGRGDLVTIRRGVFIDPKLVSSEVSARATRHRTAVVGALLESPDDTVASHTSAVVLHGWDHLAAPRKPELLRPAARSRTPSASADKVVRTAQLPASQICLVGGTAVTSPARTLIDVARKLPFLDAVVIADSALRIGGRPADLDEVLASCAGWPGVRKARHVLAFADGKSESALESVGRVRIHQYGLPPPVLQHWITDGVDRCRVDFAWEESRTIGEADGLLKYDTDPRALREEKLRQEWLENLDNQVVRFTWQQVMRQRQIPLTMDRFRRALVRGRLRRSA